MRRYLLKNNQGELKSLSEADLTQLLIRGIISFDTRLMDEHSKLWCKAGAQPFYQKFIAKNLNEASKKSEQNEVEIKLKAQIEKLKQVVELEKEQREHFEFISKQRDRQNQDLKQEIEVLSTKSVNSLQSETFNKLKADYKENIIELDNLRAENRQLVKQLKDSNLENHNLALKLDALQAKFDLVPKNSFEQEYLQLLSQNKKEKIKSNKIASELKETEAKLEQSMQKATKLEAEIFDLNLILKETRNSIIETRPQAQVQVQVEEVQKPVEQETVELQEELAPLSLSEGSLESVDEDLPELSLGDDLIEEAELSLEEPQTLIIEDIPEQEILQEKQQEDIQVTLTQKLPELRTLELDEEELDDELCLNEELEEEASESQEDLFELSNEPIWQIKGVEGLDDKYTLLQVREFREEGKIKEATFIKKIGEWWKRYTDHYELLIPINPMKLGALTKIYVKKESLRVPMNELIQVYIDDVFSHAEILDISLGGCQVKINKSLEHLFEKGRTMRIDFNEKSFLNGIKIKGIIRRIEPEGQQYICGIQFQDLEGVDKRDVEEYIDSHSENLNLTAA